MDAAYLVEDSQIGHLQDWGPGLAFWHFNFERRKKMFSDLIIDFGLARNELRYILDPKDVYGPDFPGETFRVLKGEKQYGEYRTRRLVLEAWDRIER